MNRGAIAIVAMVLAAMVLIVRSDIGVSRFTNPQRGELDVSSKTVPRLQAEEADTIRGPRNVGKYREGGDYQ